MNKQVIIGLLTLSMVARLVATPESDYKDFVKTFCQVAAGLNKTQKLITDDPQFNNSPLAELLVTTGANGGKRLCNVFTQVDTLVGSFNPQDQHSLLATAKKLEAASVCMQKAATENERSQCLAQAVTYTYDLIKPFLNLLLGEIRGIGKDKRFYEGSLLHMSHLKEFIPEMVLEKNPSMKGAIDKFEESRDKMVIPFIAQSLLPSFELIRALGVSLGAMSDGKITDKERRELTEIPPLSIVDLDKEVATIDFGSDKDALAILEE
jgi:hypothetical protein